MCADCVWHMLSLSVLLSLHTLQALPPHAALERWNIITAFILRRLYMISIMKLACSLFTVRTGFEMCFVLRSCFLLWGECTIIFKLHAAQYTDLMLVGCCQWFGWKLLWIKSSAKWGVTSFSFFFQVSCKCSDCSSHTANIVEFQLNVY